MLIFGGHQIRGDFPNIAKFVRLSLANNCRNRFDQLRAMGIKTVIRQCYKLLARSPELREAIALDELQEIQIPQHLGLELDQEQKDTARIENTKRLEAMQQTHSESANQSASSVTNDTDAEADARAKAHVADEAPAPSHQAADAAIVTADAKREYQVAFENATERTANGVYQGLMADLRLTAEEKEVFYPVYTKALKAKKVP